MPFPDEHGADGVKVVPYRPDWASEAAKLATDLSELVPAALVVHHVGSTAVPELAAKDCLDMMIVVEDLELSGANRLLTAGGYRRRPEPWNNSEDAYGRSWPKMVFAPPSGARSVNIHVRPAWSGSARLALLFRDHLRAMPDRAQRWSDFKVAAAAVSPDLAAYGQLKLPVWTLIMELAQEWATKTDWTMK